MPTNHFIVGMWRSGTSLLREILGMSDETKIFPEHFVLLHHLAMAANFGEKQKNDFFSNLSVNPDFIHFAKPDLDQLQQSLFRSQSFEEAINSAYTACLKEGENPKIFIDKNPIYSYYLKDLLLQFPSSKFVWMIREPKDNCYSRSKHNIQYLKSYAYLAHWWNMCNHHIAGYAQANPDRFLLVNYDYMVEEPKTVIQEVCTFLNITFNEEMLAFEKKKDERTTEFVMAAKARDGELSKSYIEKKTAMWENLQKPINTSKTKQWLEELSQSQIDTINAISLDYYTSLQNRDIDYLPKSHPLWSNLAKMSLAKMKWDIKRKAKF